MEEVRVSESCASFNTKLVFMTRKFEDLALSSPSTGRFLNVSTHDSSREMSFSDHQNSDTNEVLKDEVPENVPPVVRRSSVWKLFDPLHPVNEAQTVNSESCNNVLADKEKANIENINGDIDSCNELLNKNIRGGKTLISFESPKKLPRPLVPKHLFPNSPKPFKKYTEDEFRQVLKTQDCRLLTEHSNKYNEYEARFAEEDLELERELSKFVKLNKTYTAIASDFVSIIDCLSSNNEETEAKLQNLAVEDDTLKADIKTTKENVIALESDFSQVHKRYEQSKGMTTTFKENEACLLKSIDIIKVSLDEQDSMNITLKSRTEEVLEKAEEVVQSVKKSSETQVAVLEAQLKKSQMKICSMENDLKQVKFSNDKLASIYDDLMSKISG